MSKYLLNNCWAAQHAFDFGKPCVKFIKELILVCQQCRNLHRPEIGNTLGTVPDRFGEPGGKALLKSPVPAHLPDFLGVGFRGAQKLCETCLQLQQLSLEYCRLPGIATPQHGETGLAILPM